MSDMPDAIFADPRLAVLYDTFEGDRADLDAYVAMLEEFGARSVVDVGCGTGSFACLVAARGVQVVALDPASASLDVARGKPHAESVRWVHGDTRSLPPLQADLATMTANVAQVFVTDEEWAATLQALHPTLRPGGRLVFESRRPERQAWREWTRERSWVRADVPPVGRVETWVQVTQVRDALVSFRWTFRFERDGTELTSDSTLRFRGLDEFVETLEATGFSVEDVRDAPDRPGHEYVIVARRGT